MASRYIPSFDSCLRKINRADTHSQAIDAYIAETFRRDESDRPIVRPEFDEESGYYIFKIKSIPDYGDFPARCGLLLGDFVQNLRAALDHLCFQLAKFHKNGILANERRVQFPITESTAAWQRDKARYLQEVRPDHRALIKSLQPSDGTKTNPETGPIALLRDLSNTDKHRLINPVLILGSGMNIPRNIWDEWDEDSRTFDHSRGLLELNAEFMRAKPRPGVKTRMNVEGRIAPEVAIVEGRPFPLIYTLNRMRTAVLRVIETFRARPELSG